MKKKKTGVKKWTLNVLWGYASFATVSWTADWVTPLLMNDYDMKNVIKESLHTQDNRDKLYEEYLLLKLGEIAQNEPFEEVEKMVVEYAEGKDNNGVTLSNLISEAIRLAPSKMHHQFPILMQTFPIVSHTSTDGVVRTFTWDFGHNGYGSHVFIKRGDYVREADFLKVHMADKSFGGDIVFKEIIVTPVRQDSVTNYAFEILYTPEVTKFTDKKGYKEVYSIDSGKLVRIGSQVL